MVPFSFANQEWRLVAMRALFWPRENALVVADLHLEKASFFAGTGQMLPPYDSRETLERVAQALRMTGARRVYTLGDNFHDANGPQRLEPHARGMLDALTRAVDWVWITGNHDEAHSPAGHGRIDAPGGTEVDELEVGGALLRHQAKPGETRVELSGHYHPRLQIKVRERRIVRPCVVMSQSDSDTATGRMILPAFGSLTAGMDAGDKTIMKAMQPACRIAAKVPVADRLLDFPLWQAERRAGQQVA
ncbi:ligase-associated DNA damage response endonuclease PdeM [Croceicoccus sp. F390]|uniref:Ligase-associated DNA damage response endonuclease PdeM n=1 Tax=Croceicoccus esteveae TaxID=3075597 RepID=A0ABU2ZE99_9SPHN|nr:ligase-associated DNA damage response endonuclease PdeM [Croceicoccus sp. F390]MDT0574931.1 ligase-associated DNA damage response endonuclease PdeM [Croceicoccus sp. F390]